MKKEKEEIVEEDVDENNQKFDVDSIKEKLKKVLKKETIKTIAICFLSFIIFCAAMSNDAQQNVELRQSVNELTSQSQSLEKQISTLKNELEGKNRIADEAAAEARKYKEEKEKLQEEKTKLEEEKSNLQKEKDEISQELEALKVSKANKSSSSSSKSSSSSRSSSSSSSDSSSSSITPVSNTNSETVYVTNTGSKYHRSGCSYLKSSRAMSKSDAIASGYTACSRCNP